MAFFAPLIPTKGKRNERGDEQLDDEYGGGEREPFISRAGDRGVSGTSGSDVSHAREVGACTR
jgi:hypothetical protein